MTTKVYRGGRRVPPPASPDQEPGRWRFPYDPYPKQAEAHGLWSDELLYGGAAGGGKTDFLIAEAILTVLELSQRLPADAPRPAALILRRSFEDLRRPGGIIPRLFAKLGPIGTYNAGNFTWTLRNGAQIELGHLAKDADVGKYQGAEYALIGIDQVEQFTEWQVRYLTSRLRAAGDLRDAMEVLGYRPRLVMTANPGGPGHTWVKARFVDPAPPGVVWLPEPTDDEPEPGTRVFIPAKHTDNPALDESYRRRLRNLPPDERRALEEGDWDVFVGQRFKQFRRAVHVVEPFAVPLGGVRKVVGADYGLAAPFVALWIARINDQLVVYREVDGAGYTPERQAQLILESEAAGERRPGRSIGVALDPSTWARDPRYPEAKTEQKGTVPPLGSIARAYFDAGLPVGKANNDRLAGVARIDRLLTGTHIGHDAGDGWLPDCPARGCRPGIVVFETCRNLIRTLPSLVRDKRNVEDVDTASEDHWYDALRYGTAEIEGPFAQPPSTPTSGGPSSASTQKARKRHSVGKTELGSILRRRF